MRLYWIFVTLLISFSTLASQDAKRLLISHDKTIYNPLVYAIKNISFTVEIDGLAKEISSLKSYGTISKISFDIKVNKLKKYDIKVVGIPKGFKELANNLRSKLIPYLELLFPQSLNNFYRSYDLKVKNSKVTAIDPTYLKSIRESYLLFDKSGVLIENKIKTPQGTQIINFDHVRAKGGLQELLLSKVGRKIIYGPSHLLSNTRITYNLDGEKPVPVKIVTEFTFENKENNSSGNRVNKLNERYTIRNFKIN